MTPGCVQQYRPLSNKRQALYYQYQAHLSHINFFSWQIIWRYSYISSHFFLFPVIIGLWKMFYGVIQFGLKLFQILLLVAQRTFLPWHEHRLPEDNCFFNTTTSCCSCSTRILNSVLFVVAVVPEVIRDSRSTEVTKLNIFSFNCNTV